MEELKNEAAGKRGQDFVTTLSASCKNYNFIPSSKDDDMKKGFDFSVVNIQDQKIEALIDVKNTEDAYFAKMPYDFAKMLRRHPWKETSEATNMLICKADKGEDPIFHGIIPTKEWMLHYIREDKLDAFLAIIKSWEFKTPFEITNAKSLKQAAYLMKESIKSCCLPDVYIDYKGELLDSKANELSFKLVLYSWSKRKFQSTNFTEEYLKQNLKREIKVPIVQTKVEAHHKVNL